jgi:hypothetical protein
MALADFQALVTDKLRETASLVDAPQKTRAIQEAVKDYSRKVQARHRVSTITGDGALFTFALPAGFEEGMSSIERIEYPVDQQEPEYLDAEEYVLRRDPATGVLQIRFISLVLGTGKKAYVEYTTPHALTDAGEDSVPPSAREPIACKATAILLRQLAAYAAQGTQSTLAADVVDRGSQVEQYLSLASALEGQYTRAFGISDGIAAASAVADLDVTPEWGGDRFFHSRFRR